VAKHNLDVSVALRESMNYWLDLFTGTTWKEFRDDGAKVSGFSAKRRSAAERMKKWRYLAQSRAPWTPKN